MEAPKGFRYVPLAALGIDMPGLMAITQEEYDRLPKCEHKRPDGRSSVVQYELSDGRLIKKCLRCCHMEVIVDEKQQSSVSGALLRALRSLFPHAPAILVDAPGSQTPRVDSLVVEVFNRKNPRFDSRTVRYTVPIPQGSGLRFSFEETKPSGPHDYANSFGGKG